MTEFQATYRHEVNELAEPGRLRLTVFVQDEGKWSVLDIKEGPARFVLEELVRTYTPELKLRKVKR